jgi:hypothetical protein
MMLWVQIFGFACLGWAIYGFIRGVFGIEPDYTKRHHHN